MITKRLKLILTTEELGRLVIVESDVVGLFVVVDVHGMTCIQARRLIKNIINTANCTFQLEVIHGYNHGTAIKDMLAEDFKNSHVSEQHQDIFNKGVTHMSIAA